MPQSTGSRETLLTLQIYRGVAALAVLLFHVGFIAREKMGTAYLGDFFTPGALGVDFFFVLSGFIIALAHEQDFGKPQRAPRFILKRLIRIFPALWAITGLKLIYMFAVGTGVNPAKFDLQVIVSSLLCLPLLNGKGHIVNVEWSLCHEMLFYLIFCIGILSGKRFLAVVAAAWGVTALSMPYLSSVSSSSALGFVFSAHNFQFVIGYLAFGIFRSGKSRKGPAWVGMAVSCLFLGYGLLTYKSWLELGLDSLQYCLFWGAVFGVLLLSSAQLERLMRVPVCFAPLKHLGDGSYSVYLTHTAFISPIILILGYTARHSFGMEVGFVQAALSLIAVSALLFGLVFYRLIEAPLLRISQRIVARHTAVQTVANPSLIVAISTPSK